MAGPRGGGGGAAVVAGPRRPGRGEAPSPALPGRASAPRSRPAAAGTAAYPPTAHDSFRALPHTLRTLIARSF
eukprot:335413-Chlamydomonas_euryale.AAC.1